MSADTLRSAAAVLRERAEAASPGPWRPFEQHGRDFTDEGWSQIGVTSAGHDVALTHPTGFENDYPTPDARYIATMHPGVGLALADWLDNVSEHAERYNDGLTRDALSVAHLILGGAS